MITLTILIALEVILVGYIGSRLARLQVAPTPMLRATTLTAVSLLLAMFSVTEPVEMVLRGPGSIAVGVPTVLKSLGILGCGGGVLLMGLAQRKVQRPWAEALVWTWASTSALAVIILHITAGGGGHDTSVDFVAWSHSQSELVAAMMVAYVGGLLASLGFITVVVPLNMRSAAGRGLALIVVGALLSATWTAFRIWYVLEATTANELPDDGDLVLTQMLSVVGLVLINIGLVWSTAEADVVAFNNWRQFRDLHSRVVEVLPEVQRSSDVRLGVDTWISDRAVELLDGLHQIEQASVGATGFPAAPQAVSVGDVTSVAAGLGRQYQERTPTR